MESNMTRGCLFCECHEAVTVGEVLIWKAEATPLAGATTSLAFSKIIQLFKRRGACPARTAVLRAPNGLVLSIRAQLGKRAFAGLASSRTHDGP